MAQVWAKAFYNSKQWQQCREAILKRDRYRCQTVGCYQPAEEVHHIEKLTQSNINDSNVLLNPKNLISLCRDCHMGIHKGDKVEGIIKNKKESDILPWIEFDEEGYPIEVAAAENSPRGDVKNVGTGRPLGCPKL